MQASAEKIWTSAQEHLRSMLSRDTYNLWFAPLRACGQDSNGIVLEVANDFCEVWLKDNYMGLLQDVVALASGHQLQIRFKVGSGNGPVPAEAAPTQEQIKPVEIPAERDRKSTRLNSSHANISYAVFCLIKKKRYDQCCRTH